MSGYRFHIANILTLFRIVLIPFFMLLIFGNSVFSAVAALVLFVLAGLSDYLDGLFARRLGLHSAFGEFLDPLADKLLVGSAFIAFVLLPELYIPFWLVSVILLREVFVTLLRIVAIKRASPMKTEYLGKIKTAFQMLTITVVLSLLILHRAAADRYLLSGGGSVRFSHNVRILFGSAGKNGIIQALPLVLVSASALLAFVSMVQYVIKNRELFSRSR